MYKLLEPILLIISFLLNLYSYAILQIYIKDINFVFLNKRSNQINIKKQEFIRTNILLAN